MKLTQQEKDLLDWAERSDGQESHEVMGVKIRRLAVLVKRLQDQLENRDRVLESVTGD